MRQEDLIIDKVRKALAVADLLTQLLDTPILLSDTLPQIGNILTGYLKEIRDVIEEDDVSEYTENIVTSRAIDSNINDEIIMPIECIKCVLPRPAPPYIKSGLYTSAGDSATANAYAWAKLLFPPTTKFSKV